MKIIFILILIFVQCAVVSGQVHILKGIVKDSVLQGNQSSILVYLLRSSDSTIYKFTRTDNNGIFIFKGIEPGKFIISITDDRYEKYNRPISLLSQPFDPLTIEDIYLTPKGKVLAPVTVLKKLSIVRMKGDTTEFYVDSIKLSSNANVEDLLRNMPGIQVDRDGTITAQGQVVQKILVDGNEFFNEDPTLVTKNLHASMVERIQLYDAKSKQEAFSGIEDGKRKTTLNLKLKQNSRNGYFGKTDLGAGSDHFYQAQAMFNDFLNKRKLAVYGNLGNANQRNINLDEQDNESVSTLAYQDNDLELWDGNYDNHGIPILKSLGAHYNNTFQGDKQLITTNYSFSNLSVSGENTSALRQILPGNSLSTGSHETFDNTNTQNKIFASFQTQVSKSTRIEVSLSGLLENKGVKNQYENQTSTDSARTLNKENRNIDYKGNKNNFLSEILVLHKFGKNTISASVAYGNRYSSYSGYLKANTFFTGTINSTDSEQVINQRKTDNVNNQSLSSRIIITRQLSKTFKFSGNYSLEYSEGDVHKNVFNYVTGFYNEFDTLNSNISNVKNFTQKVGTLFTNVYGKLILNWGVDFGKTILQQCSPFQKYRLQENYFYWYPKADFIYQFSRQKILSFTYQGRPSFPTIQQLNPSYRNEDPLYLYLGNTFLLPSYEHNFNLLFRNFNISANRTILLNSSFSTVANAITINATTDSSGKSIIQSVNANTGSTNNANLYFLYSKRITRSDFNLIFDAGLKSNSQVNYAEGIYNRTIADEYTLGLGVTKFRQSSYELSLNVREVYTATLFSLKNMDKIGYWATKAIVYFDFSFLRKCELNVHTIFNFQQSSKYYGAGLNQILCNAWVGRKFFPSESILLKCSVNDLFNQNLGFTRVVSNNLLSQNSYTTIKRYLMLSLIWNFNKQRT